MSSLEKALLIYCSAVSFFCVALLMCVFRLQSAMVDLNKNQAILEQNLEEVDSFNVEMWENQIKINRELLGIGNETY